MNLVTGATGILGSHVVLSLLMQDQPVTAAKRPSGDLKKVRELFSAYDASCAALFEKIIWKDLDILDYAALEEALAGVETVFHCAGMVSFDEADRAKLFRMNESGTANVVNACLQHGGIRLCHVSSIGAINNSDRQVLTEDVFWKKSGKESAYALSKYSAERQVWRGIEEGLQAVIVNPGVIIAPVFWDQSSGQIFRKCSKGTMFYTGGTTAYISAMDAARAMITLMRKAQYGSRFILAENNYSFRSVIGRIQANFGKRRPFIRVPRTLFMIAARISAFFSFFSRKRPVLTKSLLNSAYNSQIYSGDKARSVLDFEFEPMPLVLDRICVYYQTVNEKSKPSV